MHPNVFLKTFWRMDIKPQIFVAMSFAESDRERYEKVISPAISTISVNGVPLTPYRVDNSKSGDSILTDIMDGIAHSQMVLADVSSSGRDSKTGEPHRNGNVMYEVGLALACRQPSEVLLVRDDRDKFLFDVSTVQHMHIDFTDMGRARELLQLELLARLRERNYLHDVRVHLAVKSLSNHEIKLLSELVDLKPEQARGWNIDGTVLSTYEAAIMRLLDKQLIALRAKFEAGYPAYSLTPLGRIVAAIAQSGIPSFQGQERITQPSISGDDEVNQSDKTADINSTN